MVYFWTDLSLLFYIYAVISEHASLQRNTNQIAAHHIEKRDRVPFSSCFFSPPKRLGEKLRIEKLKIKAQKLLCREVVIG